MLVFIGYITLHKEGELLQKYQGRGESEDSDLTDSDLYCNMFVPITGQEGQLFIVHRRLLCAETWVSVYYAWES